MVPFNPKKVEKDWGYELWLANNQDNNYCGKILFIEKGNSTSMHYHEDKHETFYVIDGTLRVDMLKDKSKPKQIGKYLLHHIHQRHLPRLLDSSYLDNQHLVIP